MQKARHDPDFARKHGIDPAIAKEFLDKTPEHAFSDLPEKASSKKRKKHKGLFGNRSK